MADAIIQRAEAEAGLAEVEAKLADARLQLW
jgi:hypothetical protein